MSDADLDDVVRECQAANAVTDHLEQSFAAEVARRRASGRASIVWGLVGLLVTALMFLATWESEAEAKVFPWFTLACSALSLVRGLVNVRAKTALRF